MTAVVVQSTCYWSIEHSVLSRADTLTGFSSVDSFWGWFPNFQIETKPKALSCLTVLVKVRYRGKRSLYKSFFCPAKFSRVLSICSSRASAISLPCIRVWYLLTHFREGIFPDFVFHEIAFLSRWPPFEHHSAKMGSFDIEPLFSKLCPSITSARSASKSYLNTS